MVEGDKLALVSVSDKTGLVGFCRGVVRLGFEVLSTGGTQKILEDAGIAVTPVSRYTGFPEILGGRVKTLHPKIYGGILAVRGREEHMEELGRHGIKPIDMVVVNLYPFEETVSKPGVRLEEALEQIDIGGPSLLRAAAKNFRDVVVVCNPRRYGKVLMELEEEGDVSVETRLLLAQEVFEHTSAYDRAIASYLKRRGLII